MRANVVAAARGRFFSNSGSPIHQLYSGQLMNDGDIQLVECGTENTDEIIQSYYESTTLEAILTRFANGDLTALNRYHPIYADVYNAPKDLASAMQLMFNAQAAFDALPVDIKQQFGNDYKAWILSSQDKEWIDIMKPVFSPDDPASAADPTPEPDTDR